MPLLAPHLDLADVLLQDVDLGRERHVVRLHAAVPLVVGRLVLRQEGHLVLELPHLGVELHDVLLDADVAVDVSIVTVGAPPARVEAAGGLARIVIERRGERGRAAGLVARGAEGAPPLGRHEGVPVGAWLGPAEAGAGPGVAAHQAAAVRGRGPRQRGHVARVVVSALVILAVSPEGLLALVREVGLVPELRTGGAVHLRPQRRVRVRARQRTAARDGEKPGIPADWWRLTLSPLSLSLIEVNQA